MATTFNFSKTVDFPTDQVSLTVLGLDISLGSDGLSSKLKTIDSLNTTVVVAFNTDLDANEETELNTIISNHAGIDAEQTITIGFNTEFNAGLETMLTTLLDEDDGYTYVGEAIPGTSTSESKWRIFRLDETNVGSVELVKTFANSTATFDKIWNDRVTYNYDP